MSVKDYTLRILEECRGEIVSGGTIAKKLDVSRQAVGKAVASLKADGYTIKGMSGCGYLMPKESDIISAMGMMPYLTDMTNPDQIQVYRTIDSTNSEAKRCIAEANSLQNIPYGAVIIADEQTSGRGRRGREFFSPSADSIYISFILKPSDAIGNSLFYTIAAAIAVCRTIERVCGNDRMPRIKWVNDIFVAGKKICGILTEAISDIESGNIESIVLGIGVNINVSDTDFPKEIRDTAGSLHIAPGNRNRFAGILTNEVLSVFAENEQGKALIEEYRSHSLMPGADVTIMNNTGEERAVCKDIADDGGLIVRYEDGRTETLRSGEVSIRLQRYDVTGKRM